MQPRHRPDDSSKQAVPIVGAAVGEAVGYAVGAFVGEVVGASVGAALQAIHGWSCSG
jgi:outer membrane lipoprotein SlyB